MYFASTLGFIVSPKDKVDYCIVMFLLKTSQFYHGKIVFYRGEIMTYTLNEFPHTKIADNLPQELKNILDKIITCRVGILPESHMITKEIISYTEPHGLYCFKPGSLSPVEKPQKLAKIAETVVVPRLIEIEGSWEATLSTSSKEGNILGQSGTLYTQMADLRIEIEEPTPEKLAYYHSILINTDEIIHIEANNPLPVSVMTVGQNYAQGYLKLENYGGGYYIEIHDTPHLWSHQSPEGGGALLLGKKVQENKYHLSAFKIPFGQAIYAPGGVIHCDGLLIGDLMVIYTVTSHYSTVIIKNQNGSIPEIALID